MKRIRDRYGVDGVDTESPAPPTEPIRPQDAFFFYVETPRVLQQVGGIICIDGDADANPGLRMDAISARAAQYLKELPLLRRTPVRRGRLRRPAWQLDVDVDIRQHLAERRLAKPGDVAEWNALVHEFFSTPVPLDRPPWQLMLVHGGAASATVILAKMHHALGDGLAVLGTLIGLLADEDVARRDPPRPLPRRDGWPKRLRRYRKVVTGLASLALSGTSPRLPGDDKIPTPGGRQFAWAELSTAAVAQVARAHRVNSATLFLAVVSEALYRTPAFQPPARRAAIVRALVPKTTRGALPPSGAPRAPGNWNAALTMDLPVGPMSVTERLAEIVATVKRLERLGQPAGAQVGMAVFGMLPAPLHAMLLRLLYGRRFFNIIVSLLPGPGQTPHLVGASVGPVFPILPLANGVGLGVCTLRWGDMTGVGVTTDTGLIPDSQEFAAQVLGAFDDLRASARPR